MTDILQLPGWTVSSTYDHADERIIEAHYTEALNGTIKVINRNARGYGFDVLRAKVLSRNKLLHPVEAPAMTTVFERCACCGGLFEMQFLEVHHIKPMAGIGAGNTVTVCPTCHRRFHTEGTNHENQLST